MGNVDGFLIRFRDSERRDSLAASSISASIIFLASLPLGNPRRVFSSSARFAQEKVS